MPLTQEQIDGLLTKKTPTRNAESPKRLPYRPQNDPLLRKQIGPIVYHDTKQYCVSSTNHQISNGEIEKFECRTPTYITFQGQPHCATHVIQLANQMLVAKGVLS